MISDKNALKEKLEETLSKIKKLVTSHEWNISNPEHSLLWGEMVDTAKDLHKLVKPKHHKYMIENRGCSPDDSEFYNHIHPVEDLLAFMDNPKANDDPEDQTIGHEFELKIFTRRWGHDDIYKIKRISSGWEISHMPIFGICDKSGKPYLYENLKHDSVNYPEALPGYMEWLWEQAAEQGMLHGQVQESLDQLGEWIKICEQSSLKGIWEFYK